MINAPPHNPQDASSLVQVWNLFLLETAKENPFGGGYANIWLQQIVCVAMVDGTLELQVREEFTLHFIQKNYFKYLTDKFSDYCKQVVTIDLTLNPELPESTSDVLADNNGNDDHDHTDYLRNSDISFEEGSVRPTSASIPQIQPQLNSRFTFDSFIGGPSNQFALAACHAVAKDPGNSYSPLFLFGRTGLGKTHLLSALGHEIVRQYPHKRVIYLSAEQFTNEVVQALHNDGKQGKRDFCRRYQESCDVLLLDDIQLIAKRPATQRELFHIFNAMHNAGKQIVIASDQLPHEIPDIEARLVSRFASGLVADIQRPEVETRVAILQAKADESGQAISSEVAFFLAESICSNVRELEGALIRVLAHASLTGGEISVPYAKQVLGDIVAKRLAVVSIESVQQMVAKHFDVCIADLKSRRRQKTLVRPRQVAMYLARKHVGASYPDLGKKFGNKDHTTVMSACKRIDSQLEQDDHDLRVALAQLERQIDAVK